MMSLRRLHLSGRMPLASLALFMTHIWQGRALEQAFCSSSNTGLGNSVRTDLYQSNGACFTTCQNDFEYAIVQYQNCWCSNSLPDTSTDVSNCNQNCPGFPSEKCGSTDNGLFGYILLPKAPANAAIGSGSGSSSPSPPSSGPPPSSPSPNTFTSPTSPSRTTNRPQTSVAITSTQVVTLPGGITTRTVTSYPTSVPESNSQQQPLQSSNLNGGAIAGIVVGVLVGVALILLAAFFCLRRRTSSDGDGVVDKEGKMKRNTSVLSRTGLLSSRLGGQSMDQRNSAPLYINTNTGNNSNRHSALFGNDLEHPASVTPNSPLGGSSEGSRRQSRPMVYDQRLNPSALFANHEANGSRVSMQDQQDYSRPLGIMNPDPRTSFDSRLSRDDRPGN